MTARTLVAAGLDIGSLWSKAVVVREGAVLGAAIVRSGDSSADTAEEVLRLAAGRAGVDRALVGPVVATGAGKKEVAFALEPAAEVLCLARGAARLHPEARGAIDMGGESTRVVKLDERGVVLDYAVNEKCAAGTGVFLDAMAKALGVEMEQMGPLSLESTVDIDVNNTCVVFAESEVVSLVHRQTPKRDILRGVHRGIAARIHGLANRIGLGPGCLALGGLALNRGIVHWLEQQMKHRLHVPADPQLASALGAALIAAEKGGGQ